MNDVEPMDETEQRLRAELHRTIVPPPTPERLRVGVDRLAAAALATPASRRSPWRETLAMRSRTMRFGLGVLAVVGIVVVAGLALRVRDDHAGVATQPHPTLPAVTQPALPSPAAKPTILTWGAWVDANTALVVDSNEFLWWSTDGAQTWPGPRATINLPPTFFDAAHGYFSSPSPSTNSEYEFLLYRTDDGGLNWRSYQAGVLPAAEGTTALSDAHFTDPLHGVVLGTSVVDGGPGTQSGKAPECADWATDDGGETWTPVPSAPCFLGVTWGSPTLGLVYTPALGGSVSMTQDAGRTWREGRLPGVPEGDRFATAALVPLEGGGARLLVHRPPAGDGTGDWTLAALETFDGGATWHEAWETPENPLMSDVSALTADHLLAIVAAGGDPLQGSILRESWDGGRTWTDASPVPVQAGSEMQWSDRLHGMLEGVPLGESCTQDVCTLGTMLLTNDGGQTWHQVPF